MIVKRQSYFVSYIYWFIKVRTIQIHKKNNMQDIISIPTFSLNPSSLSLYNSRFLRFPSEKKGEKTLTKIERENALKNIYGEHYSSEKRFHNFKISEQSHKNIMQKINWLYFLAKSKSIKTISGKEIYNFKINFITLTLPSKQIHPTNVITSQCLNQFITEMKKLYNIENLVWRLEFQKNGNVHYHICTDVYLDYYIVLKHWNRIINKLGYVDIYAQKHQNMSLNDYIKTYNKGNKNDFNVMKSRYLKGRQFNWQVPNSVDVKPVTSGKQIAFYISKYFSKKDKSGTNKNELDTIENSQGLRLWFCSRSLSKLKKIRDFVPAFDIDVLSIVLKCKRIFKAVHEYCTTYFFDFSQLENEGKAVLYKLLKDYAFNLGYKPAIK